MSGTKENNQNAKEYLAERISKHSNTSSEKAHQIAAETARRADRKQKGDK